MSRYIDVDELMSQIIPDPILEPGCPEPEGIEEFAMWLDMAETKDVVEVVRCKDRKYKRLKNLTWFCPFGLPSGPDGYCSYGERKSE